ncbi:hypothetical protein V8Z80_08585 [Orrella sp. JC864]|uniref:hypothetical protein n=1 Tax=Orrella sp. JC864 TaxID=3120298 RepID=UPI003008DD7F
MAWYRAGTVSVSNGNVTVTGSGTAWVANARTGDAFQGPDGRLYEVTNVASNTALSIAPPYAGQNASGQGYLLIPVQGYTKRLADRAAELIADYGNAADRAEGALQALENLGDLLDVVAARENLGVPARLNPVLQQSLRVENAGTALAVGVASGAATVGVQTGGQALASLLELVPGERVSILERLVAANFVLPGKRTTAQLAPLATAQNEGALAWCTNTASGPALVECTGTEWVVCKNGLPVGMAPFEQANSSGAGWTSRRRVYRFGDGTMIQDLRYWEGSYAPGVWPWSWNFQQAFTDFPILAVNAVCGFSEVVNIKAENSSQTSCSGFVYQRHTSSLPNFWINGQAIGRWK